MPAGPEKLQDEHQSGGITEHIAQNPSSKTDSTASDHHHHDEAKPESKGDKVEFRHGPQHLEGKDVPGEEGTKEERKEKAEQMNSITKNGSKM